MFVIGQTVKFKRGNGSWSVGKIKELNEHHVTVKWFTKDGLIGIKKVEKSNVEFIAKYSYAKYFFFAILLFGLGSFIFPITVIININ